MKKQYLLMIKVSWKVGINDEMGSIIGNNTWILTDLAPSCTLVGCKWIFTIKRRPNGSVNWFKTRLVVQGFQQKNGIDYFNTYAPIARTITIRLLIALASIHNLLIHQRDAKTTFLYGDLEDKVYIKQPEGFIVEGHEKKVCKFVKSLYELKQAPKQWHRMFDDTLLSFVSMSMRPISVFIASSIIKEIGFYLSLCR